jgi:hypothetical protein
MGTRCSIALAVEDKVTFTSVNWDGYLSGVGQNLFDYYTDDDSVKELLSYGEVSMLGRCVDESVFYGRDRGEKFTNAHQILIEKYFSDIVTTFKFNYIFFNGHWFLAKSTTDVKALKNLL